MGVAAVGVGATVLLSDPSPSYRKNVSRGKQREVENAEGAKKREYTKFEISPLPCFLSSLPSFRHRLSLLLVLQKKRQKESEQEEEGIVVGVAR